MDAFADHPRYPSNDDPEKCVYCEHGTPVDHQSEPDYRESKFESWQPYKGADGQPVTFTDEQCNAIYHFIGVYTAVVDRERRLGHNPHPAVENALPFYLFAKSCLARRMLKEGKAPLVDAPPVRFAAPDYSVEVF